jgi:glycosyltransferase involved in cell wall biosynthesis
MRVNSKVVAFDDISLQLGNTGIARYWKELLCALIRSDTLQQKGITPIFLSRSYFHTTLQANHLAFPKYDFRYPAADRELISAFCESQKVDLFVSSYFTFSNSCRNLLLVYDLIPEIFGFERLNRGWMERELSFHAASSYFAISQNTAKDLRKFYPHTQDLRIDIGYPGIDIKLFHKNVSNKVSSYLTEDRYFVCVGSRYGQNGYKNGELLVKALQSLTSAEIDFSLIFIGGEPLTDEESQLHNSGKVKIYQKRFSDVELVDILGNAEALIYPSKYEGFGMPPLEALALGTPTITTQNSSLPESVGELGIFVSDEDFKGLAALLTRTNFNFYRMKLREKGPTRAKNFSWDETALNFSTALDSALNSPLPRRVSQRIDLIKEYSRIVVNLQR